MPPCPRHNPRFHYVETAGEMLLYDTTTHDVIHLDAAGAVVWGLCNGARDIDEIARLIGDAYPDERDRVRADVESAVKTLVDQGPLELLERT